jgi:hypothetical protein
MKQSVEVKPEASGFISNHPHLPYLVSHEEKHLTTSRNRNTYSYPSVNTNCFRVIFTVEVSQPHPVLVGFDGKARQFGDILGKAEV